MSIRKTQYCEKSEPNTGGLPSELGTPGRSDGDATREQYTRFNSIFGARNSEKSILFGQAQCDLKRAICRIALIIDTKQVLEFLPEHIRRDNDGGASRT